MSLYLTQSARQLRQEEREIMHIQRTGRLLNSGVPITLNPETLALRLAAIRQDRMKLRLVPSEAA